MPIYKPFTKPAQPTSNLRQYTNLHRTRTNNSKAAPDKKLVEHFRLANEKLDKIQKGLNDYLEIKRLYFPRFFFLSPDQLIEILSQSKEPRAVQPHLNKAFEGVNTVHFEEDRFLTKDD